MGRRNSTAPPEGGTPTTLVRVRARRHLSEEIGGKVVHRVPGEVFDIAEPRARALGLTLLEPADGEEVGVPAKAKK